jgi:hypothetical protein
MKDSRTERAEHTAKVAIVTGGGSVAAHLGLCRPVPGASRARRHVLRPGGWTRPLAARTREWAGGGLGGPHEVALFRPDGQVQTLRYVGETSDKKPMRLIGTRTVGDSLAFLTYQPIRDS